MPLPFGPAMHWTSPHDLLQFNFLERVTSKQEVRHTLILHDDFSSFFLLLSLESACAASTVGALLEWCKLFKVPNILMSDCGTHFNNGIVRQLARKLKVKHQFNLPYCP